MSNHQASHFALVAVAELRADSHSLYALRLSDHLYMEDYTYPSDQWLNWPEAVTGLAAELPGVQLANDGRELQVSGEADLEAVLRSIRQTLMSHLRQQSGRRPVVMTRGFKVQNDEWSNQGRRILLNIVVTPHQAWSLNAFARELARLVLGGQSINHLAGWETDRHNGLVSREIWAVGEHRVGRWMVNDYGVACIYVRLYKDHSDRFFYVDPDGSCWTAISSQSQEMWPCQQQDVYTAIRRALDQAPQDGPLPKLSQPDNIAFDLLEDYVRPYLNLRPIRASN